MFESAAGKLDGRRGVQRPLTKGDSRKRRQIIDIRNIFDPTRLLEGIEGSVNRGNVFLKW